VNFDRTTQTYQQMKTSCARVRGRHRQATLQEVDQTSTNKCSRNRTSRAKYAAAPVVWQSVIFKHECALSTGSSVMYGQCCSDWHFNSSVFLTNI